MCARFEYWIRTMELPINGIILELKLAILAGAYIARQLFTDRAEPTH